MLHQDDDLWLLEEPPIDEPSELFSIPEIRRHIARDRLEDDVGLRALLERPDALSNAWCRGSSKRKRRLKSAKHPSDGLRAT
jgi:hypothetical protein